MKAFRYERAKTVEAAVAASSDATAILKANGLDLLDRLKERVNEPDRIVTLIDVPGLDKIEKLENGAIRIGAMATLSDVAASPLLAATAPLRRSLVKAAEEAASPQLRNRATVGGNLCQHTRCGYYRVKTFDCLKRGGGGCPARAAGGVQETAGIFGNELCASAHPSSLAPVFGALGAQVVVVGKGGERRMSIGELYTAPVSGKASDTTLAPGDVITAVEIPFQRPDRAAFYEVRQRAAFDWALVSCAVAFDGGEVAVKPGAGIWLGSVAPTPIRAVAAETYLIGKSFSDGVARATAQAAALGGTPLVGNTYKVELVKVAVHRALMAAWEKS